MSLFLADPLCSIIVVSLSTLEVLQSFTATPHEVAQIKLQTRPERHLLGKNFSPKNQHFISRFSKAIQANAVRYQPSDFFVKHHQNISLDSNFYI